jgi:sugar lactone lactonase YvrE
VDVFDARVCRLGEGPAYDPISGRTLWVDMYGRRVLFSDGAELDVGAHVTAALPASDGGLVLCLPDRVEHRAPDGAVARLARYEHGPEIRSNDAKVDPAGRLWHGTMAYEATPDAGALYRLEPSGPRVIVRDVTVSNGLGWSPDGHTMYYIDTPTHRIDAFDYDPATGEPSGRRPFATLEPGRGFPDGMCVDAAGGVWVALWDGAAVHRYTPEGDLDHVLEMPTDRVTSCAFSTPDLDLLVITTAARGREDDPAAGLTYATRFEGVRGTPVALYPVFGG